MEISPELLVAAAKCLGWALLHSLWQGALIAGLLAVLLRLWRNRSAGLRHAACLVALLALVASTAATAWSLRPRYSVEETVSIPSPVLSRELSANVRVPSITPSETPDAGTAAPMSNFEIAADTPVLPSFSSPWRERLELWVPWLSAIWAAGVLILSIRHLGGWWCVHTLRRRGKAARPEWQTRCDRLADRLGLRVPARLLESLEVGTPMLAGLFKPVVLLPARIMTGLSADQIEAILAHELAHLARRDAWSNLAQLVVETLFFYHPAVWWMGSRARCEREHAADDLALSVCSDRRVYAGALVRVAELQLAPRIALAATGGDLLARIRRIVSPAPQAPVPGGWSLGMLALLALLMVGAAFSVQAEDEKVIHVAPGQSIQAAIDAAPEGSVIRLAEGEYKERVVISKPLTLEGAGWEKTRITVEEPLPEDITKAYEDLEVRRKAATTPEEKDAIATEWVQRMAQPAIWVRDATDVKLRKLRVQGLSQRGPKDGGSDSTLVYFLRAKGAVTDCAVVGPFGQGIQIANGSDVEIAQSLVAAVWSEGITVHGRGRDGGNTPSRLHLADSEIRNIYHYGVAIGSGCDSTIVERCRISGTAWHGIRYDNASPTITGNAIFQHARLGIYASGKTQATVRGNLFWNNEMEGMWCLYDNQDLVEGNTFVSNQRGGLAVSGGAKPKVVRNIFASNPVAVTCSQVSGSNGQVSPVGEPVLTANLFHENPVVLQVKDEKRPAPEGSVSADPKFRDPSKQDFTLAEDSPAFTTKIGVAEPLAPSGPWPLLDEEKEIIPADNTREYRFWTAPGGAKATKRSEDLTKQARQGAGQILADAFQLDDAAKRAAAIERIRTALGSSNLSEIRVGLAAFNQVGKVEFDKASFRPVLRGLLTSPEADIRSQALVALGQVGPSPEDLDRVIAMIDDPSGDVRTALPHTLKLLSPEGFTGKTGEAIQKLLNGSDAKATQAVWHAMWGTKISPELEALVVEASRKDNQGTGYSEVFYYALTVHQSKREPTVTRLIELAASPDTVNVAGRCLWGLQQGVALDQEPRVADLALKVLAARSDDYMRRQALQCLLAYGKAAHLEPLRELLAKPGVTGELRKQLEAALQTIQARSGG